MWDPHPFHARSARRSLRGAACDHILLVFNPRNTVKKEAVYILFPILVAPEGKAISVESWLD